MTIKDFTPRLTDAAPANTNDSAAKKPSVNDADANSGGSLLGHIWASVGVTIVLGVICCGIYPALVWGIGQAVFPIQANGSLITKDGTPTTDDTIAVGSSLIGQNFTAPAYFHPRPSAAGAGYDATSSGGTNLGPLSDKLINGVTQAAASQPATDPATTATASTASAPAAPETLAYDGVRLRCIHYALDNGISFKLYTITTDGTRIAEVPLSKFQDSSGNLIDTALVDAFPHPESDPADKTPVIAADFSTLIPGDAVTASGSGIDPHISPRNAELQKPRIAKARNITEDAVQKLIDQNTDKPGLGILGDPGVNVLLLNIALDKAAPLPAPASTPASTPASPTTTK